MVELVSDNIAVIWDSQYLMMIDEVVYSPLVTHPVCSIPSAVYSSLFRASTWMSVITMHLNPLLYIAVYDETNDNSAEY